MTAHQRGVTATGDGRARRQQRRALGSGQRRSGGGRRARGGRDTATRGARRRSASGRGEAAVGRARSAGRGRDARHVVPTALKAVLSAWRVAATRQRRAAAQARLGAARNG
jgi:hypothetical protein